MRRFLVLAIVLMIGVVPAVLFGCGGKAAPPAQEEQSEQTSDTGTQAGTQAGTQTGTTDAGGGTTVTIPGGTATGSTGQPTEAQLGAPIYPNATYVEGSGGAGSATTEQGSFSGASATFTTTDSFDDVVSFYTGKMGAPQMTSADQDGRMASWYRTTDQGLTQVTILENQPNAGVVQIEMNAFSGANIPGVPGP